MIEPEVIFILVVIFNSIWVIYNMAKTRGLNKWIDKNVSRNFELDEREVGLEKYASDLEDWETSQKPREVAIANFMRYIDRASKGSSPMNKRMRALREKLIPNIQITNQTARNE